MAFSRCCAVEQRWQTYTVGLLLFNFAGLLLMYLIMRTQQWLPLNDQAFGPATSDLTFNTSVSFATNTSWQNYVPEQSVSNFTQMVGLVVHNFTSSAIGVCIAIALVRGFARRTATDLGNFWADLVRGTLYVFLPISIVGALFLVWQGVPQTLAGTSTVQLVEPVTYDHAVKDDSGNPALDARGNLRTESVTAREQMLTVGPWASQEAIKELGTNGGGSLNANSSHPFEDPTPVSTFFEMMQDGQVVGSALIGQNFSSDKYFQPRPSAAGESGYDATSSGGSNLGPTNKKLIDAVQERADAYRKLNGLPSDALVPADAVTASASGLDPHISPANAALQVARVARARRTSESQVRDLVARYTEGPQWGLFGEPRVNVLELNLALDRGGR